MFSGILQKFERKTTDKHLIKEIDGLRFFAIITVFLFHLNTVFSKELGIALFESLDLLGGKEKLSSLGFWWIRFDLGVKVFFAISGFVLALPFLRYSLGLSDKPVKWQDYFYRRLTRLEPPFLISLLLFFLLHVFFLGAPFYEYLQHFVVGSLYAHGIYYGSPNPINPVTWSLETEAQFYLLVPVLFGFLFAFRNWLTRIILVIMLILLSFWFKYLFIWDSRWSPTILSFFGNFGVGILFCFTYLKYTTYFMGKKRFLFDVIGIISVVGLFYFYKPQGDWINMLMFNTAIFGLFFSIFKGKVFNWFFTLQWVYVIGGMCYSIYLLHYALLHGTVHFTKSILIEDGSYAINLLIQILINLPLILIVSSVFYLLIEKPCMDKDWPKKFRRFLNSKFSNTAPKV
jgi:peptidoglycan/LPS O-acetylase OafA/YrhL